MRLVKELILIFFISILIFFMGFLLYTYYSGMPEGGMFSILGPATNTVNNEQDFQNNSSSNIQETTQNPKEIIDIEGPFSGLAMGNRELALEKSSDIKGVYLTEYVANSKNSVILKNIKKLLSETELNGVVIDIKEADGPALYSSLRGLIDELHKNDIWVIARICVFKDSSQIKEYPEWYIKKYDSTSTATTTDFSASTSLWADRSGKYWLDPANKEAWQYIIDFSKRAVDFGFDELQFDYIRFPSDGDMTKILYPDYDGIAKKYEVIESFFEKLSGDLRLYSSSTILSVDLFGDVAINHQLPEIGQRITDASGRFDYISFMIYPSHFYNGFQAQADETRNLPALYFPYASTDTSQVVSSHPYDVVFRSLLSALDYLSSLDSETKIRPWLQSFDLRVDTIRGIYYDAEKIRAQISASEDSGASGWLLWSAGNIYNESSLNKE